MFTGQVLVFLLILQASLAIQSYVAEVSSELDSLSKLSRMDMVSENALLDFCMRLHAWAGRDPGLIADSIMNQARDWEEGVEEYLGSVGIGCELSLGEVVVEPLGNQTPDAIQMGFLGTNGSGRTFISALLTVRVEEGGLCIVRAYPIKVIV